MSDTDIVVLINPFLQFTMNIIFEVLEIFFKTFYVKV